MGNNNKDSYQLLAMYTSDSASETPELVILPKKKKLKRKQRNNNRSSLRGRSPSVAELKCCRSCMGCATSTTARLLITSITTAILICWITTLTYLAFVLNAEIQHLDATVQRVVAGNQGVPDALQKCHSISRELQKNQTALFNSLAQLSQQFTNFSTQVVDINSRLNKVEDQLKASPELVNVASLSNSVATFGSQIRDLELTTKQLKENNNKLSDTTSSLKQNITILKLKLSELESAPLGSSTSLPDSDALATLTATVNNLRINLTNINSTLSEKLQWALEDETKDSKLIQALQDTSANISARVTTLRDECNSKTNQITVLSNNLEHYNQQMDIRVTELSNRMSDIQGICNRLQNNTANIESSINNIKSALSLDSPPADAVIPEKLKQVNNTTDT